MAIRSETELYKPVKAYLEGMGYEVKGEVRHCDLVAIRGNEEPVIVELKRTFNLPLLAQGMERLRISKRVYLAVEKQASGKAPHGLSWGDLVRLCRRIGFGLITVRFYKTKKPLVETLCDPDSYTPRITAKRTLGLLKEFNERSADYNVGGSSKRKLVTAYREKALHCAYALGACGSLSTRRLREITGSSKTTNILQRNVYGWFRRVERGVYALTPAGEEALQVYEAVIRQLSLHSPVSKQHDSAADMPGTADVSTIYPLS